MKISYSQLSSLRAEFPNKRIVFVGGTFDLIHPGHIEFLENAKSQGDILVVAISNDKRVKERKGLDRPIQNQSSRLRVIDSIKYVDYSLITPSGITNGDYPTIRIINTLQPDVFTSMDVRWYKYLHKINNPRTKFIVDSRPKRYSSTKLIKKVLRSQLSRAV